MTLASGGVRLTAIGLKEMARAGTLLPFDILREFTAKARGKEDIPIFVPFALRDAEVTGCEIHIREAETDQFGIAYPREQEQLEHDDMRQVAGLPDRLVQRNQFGLGQQFGEPFGRTACLNTQERPRMLKHFLQVVRVGVLRLQHPH